LGQHAQISNYRRVALNEPLMVNGPTAVDVPATNTFQVSADVPFALLPVTVALMADVCRRMSRCAPFAQTKPVIEPAEQKVPF
jgi:hypothetical protein